MERTSNKRKAVAEPDDDTENSTDSLSTPLSKRSCTTFTPSTATERVIVDEEVHFEVPVSHLVEDSPLPYVMSTSDAEMNGGGSFPVVKADPPLPVTVDQISRLFDNKMAKMVTVDHLEKVISRLDRNTAKINAVSDEVEDIRQEMANDRRRTCDQIKEISEQLDRRPNGDQRREGSFLLSRRTLRVWPIDGSSSDQILANFERFVLDALKVEQATFDEIQIENTKRLRSSPDSLSYHEVAVTFAQASDRDYIAARAKNLAGFVTSEGKPLAGIKMDIPHYLLGTYKLLNDYGFHIKSIHGKDTRRLIKYDDDRMSLYLQVKLPANSNWIKITSDQVRRLDEEKQVQAYDDIRLTLMTGRRSESSALSGSNSVPLGVPRSMSFSSASSSTSCPSAPTWRPPPRPKRSGGLPDRP